MRLERETFGPVLRAQRERRGVTLEQIAAETKLGVELWTDLEDNNLRRWPKRIYARSYVRDYAVRIGLDGDEVVNEFCRLFPEWGERRAERQMRSHAAIVNHSLDWQDLPTTEERRGADRSARARHSFFGRHRSRMGAAVFDVILTFMYAGSGVLLGFTFWRSLAIAAITYNLAATLLSTRGFGWAAVEWIVRLVRALPAARRFLVSRAHGA